MKTIRIDCRKIKDEASFHDVFAEACGFPDDYGRNLDAWIDCMGDLDPDSDLVVIQLNHIDRFAERCPWLFQAINNGAAFVNWRQVERGRPALLALSYYKRD